MSVNSTDRTKSAAQRRTETQETVAPQKPVAASAAAEKAAPEKPAAATAQQSSFTQAKTPEASARAAGDPAEQALAIKEARRNAKAAGAEAPVAEVAAAAPRQMSKVLENNSTEAQVATQTTLNYLAPKMRDQLTPQSFNTGIVPPPPLTAADLAKSFKPNSVTKDELGMTHVRMDRQHNDLKVFGEQVISHLNQAGEVNSISGKVSPIPAGLGTETPKITESKALRIAAERFDAKTDSKPSVERVITKGPDGEYHSAYHVQMNNLFNLKDDQSPRRMNYLVDSDTGQVLKQWNQLDGRDSHSHAPGNSAAGHVFPAGRTFREEATQSATSNARIKDNETVTSTIKFNQNFDVSKLNLDLDIQHKAKGDLKVTLTSPSGKSVVIHDRTGGTTDNLKGKFDVSAAFAGEKLQGDWKLSVQDTKKQNFGTLKNWSLSATSADVTPVPTDPKPPTDPTTPTDPKPPTDPTTPAGKKDDSTLYAGKIELNTIKNADGTYQLHDKTRGKGIETFDAQGRGENGSVGKKVPILDNNDVWGEATDPARNKLAVDAHYGGQMTYDFFRDVLARDSIDGKGEKLTQYVHVGNKMNNAFWDGTAMYYGDGDGRESGPNVDLDTAGHEITHGLTERTAGLIYEGQSGGLNESFSDIMGVGVEWYAAQKNSNVKWDYMLFEDDWTPGTPGDALRYMDNPKRDGYSIDHFSEFNKQPEVHGSSGIANNAFYLLAEGGTNSTSKQKVESGIGIEKSLKIYGRALMNYMTPNTTFAEAREATIQAATDLHGANSVEVQRVKDSWGAVGVK